MDVLPSQFSVKTGQFVVLWICKTWDLDMYLGINLILFIQSLILMNGNHTNKLYIYKGIWSFKLMKVFHF